MAKAGFLAVIWKFGAARLLGLLVGLFDQKAV